MDLSTRSVRERDGNNWYACVNNDPVNLVDPLGLVPIESAVYHDRSLGGSNEGAQRHYFDSSTRLLRVQTADPFEAPGFDRYNDFMRDHGSITFRGGTGTGITNTWSRGNSQFGGGPLVGASLSLTLDLSVTIPIPDNSRLDYSVGTSVGTGLSGGLDLSWTQKGPSISGSVGIGIGTPEFHFQVSDGGTDGCNKREAE